MRRKAILVYIYNSFNDPLFQNILLSYIKTIQQQTDRFSFHVITFEQKEFPLTAGEKRAIRQQLEKQHIRWYPMAYHTGSFLMVKKAWDLLLSFVKVGTIRIKHGASVIIAFANVSASFVYILSRVFRLKTLVYSYEPHSEFMAELGLWHKSSPQYRLLKTLEEKAGLHSEVVLTGTKHMVEELKRRGAKGRVFRAPTAVDEKAFYFRAEASIALRDKWNVGNRKVILYIGKFGDLYYREEVIAFFKGLYNCDTALFFVVVTRFPHNLVKDWFAKYGIPPTHYYITGGLTEEEVKEYISAADMGISAVPPSPSQKFRSPTKVGEYLMCGLPYITCAGVSEDDFYAQNYKVGIVVNEFSIPEAEKNFGIVKSYLQEEKTPLRFRCRTVGVEYRSKEKVVQLMADQLKELTTI